MANSCIITGATGYIGSHVLKHLLSKGWDIHIIADPHFGYDNIEDVLNLIDVFEYDGSVNKLCNFFNSVNAEVVFHLAAAVITNYKAEQIPVLVQSNIQFGTEILEAMKESKTKLIVSTGSYWQNYKSDAYNPVDLYAATKEAFEMIMQYYVDAYQIRHINLRLYDVYGEDDKRPKLWQLLYSIAGTDKCIDISPGEQKLDMIHVDDVSRAYERAYQVLKSDNNIENAIFGVRTGKMRTLKEIVLLFQRVLGQNINVNFGGKSYKSREVMIPCQKYKYLPGWEAIISLEEGFQRFAKNLG